jgi:hypothetical protein
MGARALAAETGVVMLIYLDHALREMKGQCASEKPVTRDESSAGHHARRSRARASKDDDCRSHHRWAAGDHPMIGGML